MKIIPHFISAAFILSCLAGQPATANLIQETDPNFGPNSLTVDTSSGLAWLNLNASVGLSYQQVLADTQAGGIFGGFRFATDPEILALYASAGFSTGYFPASNQAIPGLISLLGPTSFQYGRGQLVGISGTAQNGLQMVPEVGFVGLNGVPSYYVSGVPGATLAYGDNTSFPGVGSWLVCNVPETADPATYVLAAGSLAGFVLLQKRGKIRSRALFKE